MSRDMSEMREEKLAELIEKHYSELRAKLQGCDPDTLSTIASDVSAEFASDAVMNSIVVAATFGKVSAGSRIHAMVHHALMQEAEKLAEQEADQMEQRRKDGADL